jgi:flagellar biosynthetic protein FliQ
MSGNEVIDIAREATWVMLAISGPLMGAALVVGVAIALLQALTQVQEMTLVFVPKIVTIFVLMIFLLPYIGGQLSTLMTSVAERIVTLG